MHSVNFILALACGTFAMASTVDNGATHTGTMSALVTSNPDVAVDIYGPPCCFAKNCKAYDFETQNHTLTGTCWNKITQRDWEEVNSEIDLNLCVGNQNGTLISQSL